MLLITDPSGARLPTGKHMVDVRPRQDAASGDRITSSGSTPSRSRKQRCVEPRAALGALPRVQLLVEGHAFRGEDTDVSRRPARRRWSITSGTPPARNTWTVGWLRGPFGSASTRRGTLPVDLGPVAGGGPRSPAAWAIAGTCSSRFVDPPNAACVTIAFRSDASVQDVADAHAAAPAASSEREPSAARDRARSAVPDGASAE